MRLTPQTRERRRNPKSVRWAVFGFGTPIFCLLGLFVVYYLHNRIPQIDIPTPAVPKDNAYDDFIRAGNLAVSYQSLSPYRTVQSEQGETVANFAPYIKLAEQALPLVQKALNKPCLTPPIRSYKAQASKSRSPLFELSRLIGAVARFHEMRKEPYKAASICLDGYEMWAHLGHGASDIDSMVEQGCEEIKFKYLGVSGVYKLINKNDPNLFYIGSSNNLARRMEEYNKLTKGLRKPHSSSEL